jgi:hypothetical protein
MEPTNLEKYALCCYRAPFEELLDGLPPQGDARNDMERYGCTRRGILATRAHVARYKILSLWTHEEAEEMAGVIQDCGYAAEVYPYSEDSYGLSAPEFVDLLAQQENTGA